VAKAAEEAEGRNIGFPPLLPFETQNVNREFIVHGSRFTFQIE